MKNGKHIRRPYAIKTTLKGETSFNTYFAIVGLWYYNQHQMEKLILELGYRVEKAAFVL